MTRKILRPSKKTDTLIRDPLLRRQKQEEVAAAAFDLFLKEGFHRATTRDIARRAGISAGAVFTYFRNKEEILLHIITREQERAETQLLDVLRQQIQDAARTGADPETVFVHVFATFLRAIDQLRRFILLAYQETKSLNQQARQALIEREQRLQAVLSEAMRYGVERGRFAPDNIELKAHNIMVLAHAWATRHWAFAGVMDAVEDYIAFLQPQVLAMLKSGAAVERGKEERQRPAGNGRAVV
ncbi:MAG: TetR/AcrR family transcriptional regulator [Deltaproteobacteria bacterium]|nr:TetR/AcrR family transcriptional regulator [Deltaproteobacteria bacterium]